MVLFVVVAALAAIGFFLAGVGFACHRLRGDLPAGESWRRVLGLSENLGGPDGGDPPR